MRVNVWRVWPAACAACAVLCAGPVARADAGAAPPVTQAFMERAIWGTSGWEAGLSLTSNAGPGLGPYGTYAGRLRDHGLLCRGALQWRPWGHSWLQGAALYEYEGLAPARAFAFCDYRLGLASGAAGRMAHGAGLAAFGRSEVPEHQWDARAGLVLESAWPPGSALATVPRVLVQGTASRVVLDPLEVGLHVALLPALGDLGDLRVHGEVFAHYWVVPFGFLRLKAGDTFVSRVGPGGQAHEFGVDATLGLIWGQVHTRFWPQGLARPTVTSG